jgi:hypothetical protein
MSTEGDEKTRRFNQKSFEVAAQHSPTIAPWTSRHWSFHHSQ